MNLPLRNLLKSTFSAYDKIVNDKISNIDTGDKSTFYGVCSTSSNTVAKTVTIDEFTSKELKPGVHIFVKFTNGSMVNNPTLNVSNTGAKYIYTSANFNLTYKAHSIHSGALEEFVYDGTYWILLEQIHMYDNPGDWPGAPVLKQLCGSCAGWGYPYGLTDNNGAPVVQGCSIGAQSDGKCGYALIPAIGYDNHIDLGESDKKFRNAYITYAHITGCIDAMCACVNAAKIMSMTSDCIFPIGGNNSHIGSSGGEFTHIYAKYVHASTCVNTNEIRSCSGVICNLTVNYIYPDAGTSNARNIGATSRRFDNIFTACLDASDSIYTNELYRNRGTSSSPSYRNIQCDLDEKAAKPLVLFNGMVNLYSNAETLVGSIDPDSRYVRTVCKQVTGSIKGYGVTKSLEFNIIRLRVYFGYDSETVPKCFDTNNSVSLCIDGGQSGFSNIISCDVGLSTTYCSDTDNESICTCNYSNTIFVTQQRSGYVVPLLNAIAGYCDIFPTLGTGASYTSNSSSNIITTLHSRLRIYVTKTSHTSINIYAKNKDTNHNKYIHLYRVEVLPWS